MAKSIRQLGSQDGIQLQLAASARSKHAPGLAWAQGLLTVAGQPVLANDNDKPIDWTWVDLLEWLAKNWAFILLEQDFPHQSPASSIQTLMRELDKRWEDMAESQVELEEQTALRFLDRHNLANAFKGIYFPATYLMRIGEIMEVSNAEHPNQSPIHLPFGKAKKDLESTGNGLVDAIGETSNERAQAAIAQWHNRQQPLAEKTLPLLTGFNTSELNQLDVNNSAFWEYDDTSLAETELMAAARMTRGHVSLANQKRIIERIRKLPAQATPQLDRLTAQLQKEFQVIGKPHDQGYWAANWLRHKIGIPNTEPLAYMLHKQAPANNQVEF